MSALDWAVIIAGAAAMGGVGWYFFGALARKR